MKRLERLEKKGYKVSTDMNTGTIHAKKGSIYITGSSITEVHRRILGY